MRPNESSTRPIRVFLYLLIAAAAATSGSAQADDYQLVGQWFQNSGPTIDTPINGGAGACAPAGVGACVAARTKTQTVPSIAYRFVTARPVEGGVSGYDVMTGIAPGTGEPFTLAPLRFKQNARFEEAPMPNANFIQQLATSITYQAPMTSRTVSPPANTRVMHKDAYLDIGIGGAQVGRPGKAFVETYGGSGQARLEYLGNGVNSFGGTMGILLNGDGGSLALVNVFPVAGLIGFQPLGDFAGTQPRARGMGFDYTVIGNQPVGDVHSTFATAGPCVSLVAPWTPAGCELVTMVGNNVGPGSLPSATSTLRGFPWTTGQIIVTHVNTLGGNPATETMSAIGFDITTVSGARMISLVAGGMSQRVSQTGLDYLGQIDVVEMTLFPVPEPAAGLVWLMGAPALALLYRARARS